MNKKEETTIKAPENIDEIIRLVREELDSIQDDTLKNCSGWFNTPYGLVKWKKDKIFGNKKALKWLRGISKN